MIENIEQWLVSACSILKLRSLNRAFMPRFLYWEDFTAVTIYLTKIRCYNSRIGSDSPLLMNINSILTPERTFCGLDTRSKKIAIEKASILIAENMPHLRAVDIYNSLIAREKLGPTALGNGIALPHCRIEGCKDIVGALFTINTPIDYGALDDQLVDTMFVLLVPEEEVDEHLKTMAMLAKKFGSEEYRANLKSAQNNQILFDRACQMI